MRTYNDALEEVSSVLSLGQSSSLQSLGQSSSLQGCCLPYQSIQPQIVYQCGRSDPNDFEFRVWKYGKEIRMDYGSKLKILMADPIKGIDLREAAEKLKEALQRMEE